MRSMIKQGRESGVVSLMVTMVMMIVITLVVLGFAEIARNEQRSSLDDQLSVQAYYAAESGINDVRSVINAAVASGGPAAAQNKTKCGPQGNYTATGVIDSQNGHDVAYTCVLVNTTPPSLTYYLGGTSTVIPLIANGSAFGNVTLTWNVADGLPATPSGCYANLGSLNQNPVASGPGAWGCNYSMLRVDVFDANGSISRAAWNNATTTAFLVPFDTTKVSVTNTLKLGSHGTAVPARCDGVSCTVRIIGAGGGSMGGSKYYMRVTQLYHTGTTKLTVDGGGSTTFTGAQAVIDATGRAQDVLRRVQVAVDLTDANAHPIPSGAIVTRDSVCKRFGITDSTFRVYDDLSSGGGGNVYCTLQ